MSKTYLVTGVGRGIGAELAGLLLERGDRVIGTVRKPAAAALAGRGARIETLDVSDSASVAALSRTLDGLAIDVLVNNAGVYDARQALGDITDAAMRDCFEVNTLGPLRVTQALLANLRAGPTRHVFQLTSKMGSIAENSSGGAYAYRSSKAALNAVNKSLAVDLAPEHFIACVLHPGWVATDMGGAGAPVAPLESARALLKVMDGVQPSFNGRFYNFTGEELPW